MPFSKRQSLACTALALGLLWTQAAPAAAADCDWRDPRFRSAVRAGASFAWQDGAATPRPEAAQRIALWGDSLSSARDFVDAALGAYGLPKAGLQPSFIQAGIKVGGLHLPLRASCASGGWQTGYAHKEGRKPSWYAKGLLSMRSATPGDSILLDFRSPQPASRVKQLGIVFEKASPDGSLLLAISVDGGEERLVPLSRSAATRLQIQPAEPMAAVRIRLVSGQLTVHGFEPLYQDKPAAIVDVLSVPGGTLGAWSHVDERLSAAAPGDDYNLVLVQYGTNEGASPRFARDGYLQYVRRNLGLLRARYPRARCILIGPPDRGAAGGAGPASRTFSDVHRQIASVQKQAGQEHGCAFWDWQAAMGGPGAAARWARMHPPQMQGDLTHLTAKGYQLSGRMFAEAMLLDQH